MGAHDNHSLDLAAGRNVTWAGMGINVVLIALKITGGIYGRSKALLADAAHSVSDLVSDMLVLVGLHYFRKEEDTEHPYGHGKIESLVTISIGVLLAAAAVRIGVEAALAIYQRRILAPHPYTILIAALSILAKEILFNVTVRVGKRLKSEVIVANAWHHRSDALTSVITFVGVGLAVYVPRLRILDSYAALLVSFFIVKIAYDISRSAIKKLIDTSPSAELLEKIYGEISGIPGVKACHDLTGRYYADMIRMEVHVEVDPSLSVQDSHKIADEVSARVKERFMEVSSILVHVDPYEEGRHVQ